MGGLVLLRMALVLGTIMLTGCFHQSLEEEVDGVKVYPDTVELRVTLTQKERPAGYNVARICYLKGRAPICPLLAVKQPRLTGPQGGVEYIKSIQPVITNLLHDRPLIDLPVEDSIEKYLILIREVKKEGDASEEAWRIIDVPLADLKRTLKIDYDRLPSIDSRIDKEHIMSEFAKSRKAFLKSK